MTDRPASGSDDKKADAVVEEWDAINMGDDESIITFTSRAKTIRDVLVGETP